MADTYLEMTPSERREADTELALEMSNTAYAMAQILADSADDYAVLADMIGAEPATIGQLADYAALGWI